MAIEDALVKRSVSPLGSSSVLIEETWDTSHPDCPYTWPFKMDAPPQFRETYSGMWRKDFEQINLPVKG